MLLQVDGFTDLEGQSGQHKQYPKKYYLLQKPMRLWLEKKKLNNLSWMSLKSKLLVLQESDAYLSANTEPDNDNADDLVQYLFHV